VFYICIQKEFRGNGYGKMLIEAMKERFDRVITEDDGSTEAGRGLFKKAGFSTEEYSTGNLLVWMKEKKYNNMPNLGCPRCGNSDIRPDILEDPSEPSGNMLICSTCDHRAKYGEFKRD